MFGHRFDSGRLHLTGRECKKFCTPFFISSEFLSAGANYLRKENLFNRNKRHWLQLCRLLDSDSWLTKKSQKYPIWSCRSPVIKLIISNRFREMNEPMSLSLLISTEPINIAYLHGYFVCSISSCILLSIAS